MLVDGLVRGEVSDSRLEVQLLFDDSLPDFSGLVKSIKNSGKKASTLLEQLDNLFLSSCKKSYEWVFDYLVSLSVGIGRARIIRNAQHELRKIECFINDSAVYKGTRHNIKERVGTVRPVILGLAADIDYRYTIVKYALERAGFISVGYTYPKN